MKQFVPEIRVKTFSSNQIAGFFNQHIWRTIQSKPDFLHVHTNSRKLKVDKRVFGWAVTSGCDHSGHRTLNLTVLQEWMDGMN